MNDVKDFMEYFSDVKEYPKNVLSNLLPVNEYWEYVSSSLLNGLINYACIVEARVLNRYTKLSEFVDKDSLESYQEPPGSLKWVKPKNKMSKKDVLKLYTEKGRVFHTRLSCFGDDMVILAKANEDKDTKIWVVFWFDCDNSDCCIGRFETDDSREVVLTHWRKWILESEPDGNTVMPDHLFNGWLSF